MARRRAGKKIDYVHWSYGSASRPAFPAGVAATNVFAAEHEPQTLLRLRGECLSYIDAAQAAGGGATAVGVGLIAVPEGTGTSVLWSPLSDGDAPWIWYSVFHLGYEEYVSDVIDSPLATCYREVIDSKAMRIIRNQEIQAVWESSTLLTAISFNSFLQVRALTGK